MELFEVIEDSATHLAESSLPGEKFLERQHLQEWVINNPAPILGEDVMIVTSEFDDWADADGTKWSRRDHRP